MSVGSFGNIMSMPGSVRLGWRQAVWITGMDNETKFHLILDHVEKFTGNKTLLHLESRSNTRMWDAVWIRLWDWNQALLSRSGLRDWPYCLHLLNCQIVTEEKIPGKHHAFLTTEIGPVPLTWQNCQLWLVRFSLAHTWKHNYIACMVHSCGLYPLGGGTFTVSDGWCWLHQWQAAPPHPQCCCNLYSEVI